MGVEIHNAYGQTEAPLITLSRLGDNVIPSIGTPLPDTTVTVAPDGELVVTGPQVALGYYKLDTNTFKDGKLYTGDLGQMDADGHVYISGRKKDMLITSYGKNINCTKIEQRLSRVLVLAVTAPRANESACECVTRWIGLAEKGGHRALMIDTAECSYSEAYLKKLRMLYPILGLVGKPASYARFFVNARAILAFDAQERLGRIACPTLILAGEEDRIVGAAASRTLHEGIPGSELFVYPGLGHAAYEEAKDFNRRVLAFLEG